MFPTKPIYVGLEMKPDDCTGCPFKPICPDYIAALEFIDKAGPDWKLLETFAENQPDEYLGRYLRRLIAQAKESFRITNNVVPNN